MTYLANPYLNERETALVVTLVNEVRAKTVIEFGVQMGRTAAAMLRDVPTLTRYVGIDVPEGHMPTLVGQRSQVPQVPGFCASDDPRFELIVRDHGSLDLGPHDLPPCDAAFIDGDHSEGAVLHDSGLAVRLVRKGGIIIWHDFDNPEVEVTAAIRALAGRGWPIEIINGTWLAFMRA